MKKVLLFIFLLLNTISYSQNKPKIGLVLSGGGAKGSAHIGVIRFLESKGIKPDYITGTSVGALIGGLYAMGYTVDELDHIVRTTDWDFLQTDLVSRENLLIGQGGKNQNAIISLPIEGFKPTISNGLYGGQNLITFLDILARKYNKDIDFDSLKIPFRCISTNIETGKIKVFKSGNIAKSIRSSMSIPSILTPYEIDGELYVDGGLVNNFPTDIIKEMGADIIIGVDVGAVLYKKEEIKTILQILDQSTSFYNARITEINKTLCDIYIRPDIKGIGALDFAYAKSIISRGYDAAKKVEPKIDSIFAKYKLQAIKDTIKYGESDIKIDSIVVYTNIKNSRKHSSAVALIQGKVDIKTPNTLSISELSNKINKLFGSKFFHDITIDFETKDSLRIMHINAKEKTEDEFYIGGHFDNTYGIDILVGANFRNKLIYGSLLEFKVIAGQSPQLRIRYTTDRGKKLGIGTSMEYNNFIVNSYSEDAVYSKYNYHRLYWDLFIHSYFGNHSRAIIGAEASVFGLAPTQEISGLNTMYRNNYNLYFAYISDSWNDGYFPTKGNKTKLRTDLILDENGSILYSAWLKNNTIIPISKKFVFKVDAFIGIGSKGIDTTLYSFYIGGQGNNRIQWYNAFPGLRFLEKSNSNVAIISAGPRWNFAKNNFLTYKFAFGIDDYFTERLLIKPEHNYAGMSLTYGFKSMFGPMETSVDLSMNSKYASIFVSLGFWL